MYEYIFYIHMYNIKHYITCKYMHLYLDDVVTQI